VRELAARKLASVEERLRELAAVRDDLREALADWDARLSQTGAGERARLLESLAASARPCDENTSAHAWRRRKGKERSGGR
jgi:hypothetical protein